jgi:prepilin-type processing-associated H-X9-DG protein
MVDVSQQTAAQAVPVIAVEPRTSRLAITAFVMGLLCMTFFLWPILALPAIICGIIALVKISNNKPCLKGTGYAVTGIIIPAVMIILIPIFTILLAILMPALNKAKVTSHKVACATNLKTLSLAMYEYTTDYDGQYPTPEQWCDLLIQETSVSSEVFRCPLAPEGSFSYVVNKELKGIRLSQVKHPEQCVIFFEADLGKNAAGGPDDLVLRHFEKIDFIDGEGRSGCNIGFADGHVEFATEDRIAELQWTIEE